MTKASRNKLSKKNAKNKKKTKRGDKRKNTASVNDRKEGEGGGQEERYEHEEDERKKGKKKRKKQKEGENADKLVEPFEEILVEGTGTGFASALSAIMAADIEPEREPILQKNRKRVNMLRAEKKRRKLEKKRQEERRILRRRAHVVPETLNGPKEKELKRTARKGVVQIFNLVKQKQSPLTSRTPQQKAVSKAKAEELTKRKFMELLVKTTTSPEVQREQGQKAASGSIGGLFAGTGGQSNSSLRSAKEEPNWNVLRDNFMLGAKLKDWDKEDENEEQGSDQFEEEGEYEMDEDDEFVEDDEMAESFAQV